MQANHFHHGEPVSFNYRSAKDVHGTVTGVEHQGKTNATTMYDVQPTAKNVHPGEKVPVHRSGDKLRKR